VTIPHKETAAAAADRLTGDAARTRACNTFWFEDGTLVGDNTDIAGVRGAVADLMGDARGCRVLLLGAGGAARAAACALLLDGAARIDVWNRSPDRARSLVDDLGDGNGVLCVAESADPSGFDLLVQATSLGLDDDDALPWDPAATGAGHAPPALLDLVYRPGGTRLTRAAAGAGIRSADGLGMLLYQGAAAFSRWTGLEAPLHAMRAALEGQGAPPT
jgi:shikimate dehydrogenase